MAAFALGNFSCSCLNEKIMTILDLPALNLHCASGYMRSASNCNLLLQNYTGKDLPNKIEEGYSTVVVAVTAISFVLEECHDVGITNVLGH